MNKKDLSEKNIRIKFITPAIVETAGWDPKKQIREEFFFTDGRIWLQDNLIKRGTRKKADYILYYKPNIPIAIVEAKDNRHYTGAGMQQALEYAEILDVPFVYTSNGHSFLEHDRTITNGPIEKEIPLNSFPTPGQLWQRYKKYKGLTDKEEKIVTQDYHLDATDKAPRYYQTIAINRTIEAIAKGQNRILLVMATGTGKTFTAFQVIWRLWKAGVKKRILYLADRNILVDQAMYNDFKYFGDKMHKISKRTPEKSYEIYFALYQAITGPEEDKKIFKKYSKEFFDLIVIDECHRGSAAEDSAWREILEYFSSATQIGMTATPKETGYISNISYFGEPLYIYSLKQGIQDGFLAPYKVIRVIMNKDDGWRPPTGTIDKNGITVPDRMYILPDYERELVLTKRVQCVAKRVTEFLNKTNRFDKTIIFCEDIEHAERMRQQLINENPDLANKYKYVMKITGDDDEGKIELGNFILPSETYPVIACTSRLMSTGVDSRTCKLIVIEKNINSMTEFKQIIGRGTRVEEEYGKMYFTIMDFRGATNHFADPQFDGVPVSIYEHEPDESITEINQESVIYEIDTGTDLVCDSNKAQEYGSRTKYYVDGVEVNIINERVHYLDSDGKLIMESIKDYCKRHIRKEYPYLDNFLASWSRAKQKQAIIQKLEERGVFFAQLEAEFGAAAYDPFDLICHVGFDSKPLTRRERVENVRQRDYFARYNEREGEVLDALLEKYADENTVQIGDINILKLQPFTSFGSPIEIIDLFGGKKKYLNAVKELQAQLYHAD